MEENGQRKQQATLWWGTEVGKPEEGSLLFVKSTGDFFCFVLFFTGDVLDRYSCKLTKVLFYHWPGQYQVRTCLGRTNGERASMRENGEAPEFCHV